MVKSKNWRKILVSGAALLILASTGLPGINNIANARTRHPRISRRVASKKKSKRIPWKAAWNKCLHEQLTLVWTHNSIFGSRLRAKRNHFTHHPAPTPKNEKVAWAEFFKNHTSKKALKDDRLTYPQFSRLTESDSNMTVQKKNRAYDINFPFDYNHDGSKRNNLDCIRNAEILANKPLHRFTPHMRKDMASVAVQAHNGQRVLTSFKNWMRRTHRHPKLRIGNTPYVYQGSHFVSAKGTNGYGVTYKFNTKTGRYQKVSTKRINKQINKKRNRIEQQTANNAQRTSHIIRQILPKITPITSKFNASDALNAQQASVHTEPDGSLVIVGGNDQKMLHDDENNPRLSDATKAAVKKALQAPTVTYANNAKQVSPVVALSQASSNNQLNSADKEKAAYMANTATKQLNNTNESAPITIDLNITMSTTPKVTASKATDFGANHTATDKTHGMVTNNGGTAQNAAILRDEIVHLAEQLGIMIPKGTTITF